MRELRLASHTARQNGVPNPSRRAPRARARGSPPLREVGNTPLALRANSLDSGARSRASPTPARPLARPPDSAPRCLGKAGRSPAGARGAHGRSLGTGTRPLSSGTQGPSFSTLRKMVAGFGRAARVAWPLRATVPARHAPLSPPQGPRAPSDLLADYTAAPQRSRSGKRTVPETGGASAIPCCAAAPQASPATERALSPGHVSRISGAENALLRACGRPGGWCRSNRRWSGAFGTSDKCDAPGRRRGTGGWLQRARVAGAGVLRLQRLFVVSCHLPSFKWPFCIKGRTPS